VHGSGVVDHELNRTVGDVWCEGDSGKHGSVELAPTNVAAACHEVRVRWAPAARDAAVDCEGRRQARGGGRGTNVHAPTTDAGVGGDYHCLGLCP